jgi:hypothetical protein
MSITSTSKIFSVNDSEYGYCCGSFRPVSSGSTIAMYVPKLMGAINATGGDNIVINNLIANASDCRPTFSTYVRRSKAFSPILKDNCNWLNKVNGDGVVPAGTMFTIEFVNGNIDAAYVTTK